MEALRLVRGRAVPLERSDVDTDQIIPAEWLKRVERTGFEAGLFAAWRRDPGFVLNRPEYEGATILLAGANFGCGSSREHAVWALQQYGFQAVVSPGFADIFRANAVKNGLLPVQVERLLSDRLVALAEREPSATFSIDVEHLTVEAPGHGVGGTFALDDFTRQRFLEGLDDVALALQSADLIGDYERARPPWLPALGA